MVNDLRRTHHIQSSIHIHKADRLKWFHHCLLCRFDMICMFYNNIAFCKNFLYIPMSIFCLCTKIPLVICSYRAQCLPAVLRMHQDWTIQRFLRI